MTTVPMTPPAVFVISIDLEMSWGAVHHGRPHDPTPYRRERQVVGDLLGQFDAHATSATWAVVGHLFLDRCGREGGRAHPDIVRPAYDWLDGDWYDLDPGTDVATDPTWYGPDLVAAIRGCPTPQEVASHSFGHLIVGDPGCGAEAFRSDLRAAKAVAATDGLDLRSFVYPRNSIGHLDVLAAEGFRAFRGPRPPRFGHLPPRRRRIADMVDRIRPLRGAAITPEVRGGIVDVPQTYLFDPDSTTANRLGTRAWSAAVRHRLRHAVRTGSLFHLWFHSHNLAARPDRAQTAMEALLVEARRHVDAGDLENLTMGAVADRWLAQPAPGR